MKTITLSVILFTACSYANSQPLLDLAAQQAKKEHKLILLNFSGSDWCVPCIQMQKNYFENAAFQRMADSQFVIIRADFPRKRKNQPAQYIVEQNEKLAERFNPGGSFPLTILLDTHLKSIHRWEGKPEEDVSVFIKHLLDIIKKYK